jgi:hypothetical protein
MVKLVLYCALIKTNGFIMTIHLEIKFEIKLSVKKFQQNKMNLLELLEFILQFYQINMYNKLARQNLLNV